MKLLSFTVSNLIYRMDRSVLDLGFSKKEVSSFIKSSVQIKLESKKKLASSSKNFKE